MRSFWSHDATERKFALGWNEISEMLSVGGSFRGISLLRSPCVFVALEAVAVDELPKKAIVTDVRCWYAARSLEVQIVTTASIQLVDLLLSDLADRRVTVLSW
jgi:hypothetical protein